MTSTLTQYMLNKSIQVIASFQANKSPNGRSVGQGIVSYLDVLVLKRLDVETNCRYSLHCFIALILKSVQDGRFSCVIQSKNQNADLLGTEEALEDLAKQNTHMA
jgi:hypothetical protein